MVDSILSARARARACARVCVRVCVCVCVCFVFVLDPFGVSCVDSIRKMGSGNSKKKARKNKKDIVDNPRKLKHFTTVIFTKNVTKMGDLRKALDSGYNVNLQTEVS